MFVGDIEHNECEQIILLLEEVHQRQKMIGCRLFLLVRNGLLSLCQTFLKESRLLGLG